MNQANSHQAYTHVVCSMLNIFHQQQLHIFNNCFGHHGNFLGGDESIRINIIKINLFNYNFANGF